MYYHNNVLLLVTSRLQRILSQAKVIWPEFAKCAISLLQVLKVDSRIFFKFLNIIRDSSLLTCHRYSIITTVHQIRPQDLKQQLVCENAGYVSNFTTFTIICTYVHAYVARSKDLIFRTDRVTLWNVCACLVTRHVMLSLQPVFATDLSDFILP